MLAHELGREFPKPDILLSELERLSIDEVLPEIFRLGSGDTGSDSAGGKGMGG